MNDAGNHRKALRMLIAEEALDDSTGHYLDYIEDILSACPGMGIEAQVAVHQEATAEVLSRLPAIPVFQSNAWKNRVDHNGGPLRRIREILQHNLRLANSLKKTLKTHGPFDLVLAPSNLVDHALGHYLVARWLQRRALKTHYILIFLDAQGIEQPNGQLVFPKRSLLLRWFMRLFRKMLGDGRATFCAESPGMARHFQAFSGLPFQLVPHVVRFPLEELERKRHQHRDRPRSMTFGYFGFNRYDKGGDLLQRAIHILQSRTPLDFRFLIQWTRDFHLPDNSLSRLDQDLRKDPRITYITSVFSPENYLDYLSQTDCIVLPYRRCFYRERLSRVAIDAAICGIPFIAPEGTWLETFQASYGAGTTFLDEDPASLAKALLTCLQHQKEHSTQASSKMSIAQLEFGPQKFIEAILSFTRLEIRC